MVAFPCVQRERDDLPRTYVANVINTLKEEGFSAWVRLKVDERHAARAQQQDQIQMDPEIKQYFDTSVATSGKLQLLIDILNFTGGSIQIRISTGGSIRYIRLTWMQSASHGSGFICPCGGNQLP